jgi:hypothetical protein
MFENVTFPEKTGKVNIKSRIVPKLHCLISVRDKSSGNTILTVCPSYKTHIYIPKKITAF